MNDEKALKVFDFMGEECLALLDVIIDLQDMLIKSERIYAPDNKMQLVVNFDQYKKLVNSMVKAKECIKQTESILSPPPPKPETISKWKAFINSMFAKKDAENEK